MRLPVDRRAMDVSITRFTLDADAAALSAALLVPIANAMCKFLWILLGFVDQLRFVPLQKRQRNFRSCPFEATPQYRLELLQHYPFTHFIHSTYQRARNTRGPEQPSVCVHLASAQNSKASAPMSILYLANLYTKGSAFADPEIRSPEF